MAAGRPTIPDDTLAKWQRVVDIMARIMVAPAGLVMRTEPPVHAVLVTSVGPANPYPVGASFTLRRNLYCNSVIENRSELLVRDAWSDPEWCDNQDLEHGMSFYLGHMDMVAYMVEIAGVRILIWGDNRHNPADAFWDWAGRVDVLTLPVDGSEHILSFAQGDEIVDRLKPRVVIPTHYLSEATTYTLSTLAPADEWVKGQKSYRILDSARLDLSAAEIAKMDREFLYFGNHAQTA